VLYFFADTNQHGLEIEANKLATEMAESLSSQSLVSRSGRKRKLTEKACENLIVQTKVS